EQGIGWEGYQIKKEGDGLAVKTEVKFNDPGTGVSLTARFRGKNDWMPGGVEVNGKNSGIDEINREVGVNGEGIPVRDSEEWKEGEAARQFFTVAGYAPVTFQMLLVRYWASHGSPRELEIYPEGRKVRIEPRGQDKISFQGKTETLQRYLVEGLIWGRE